MELGEQLQSVGASISALGMQILPYSFAMYMPVRWLEFLRNRGYSRVVKATWYVALGAAYLVGGVDTIVIVTYICFIEACDLFFQQLELDRERRAGPYRRGSLPLKRSARDRKATPGTTPGERRWALMARILSMVSGQ